MDKPLEKYLAEVSNYLGPLPLARREEEIKEMRQHLQCAITAYQDEGQSEEEASANAIKQFGKPEELGKKVVWAWRRADKREYIRSFLGAWLCFTAWRFLRWHLHFIGSMLNVFERTYRHDAYILLIGSYLFGTIWTASWSWISGYAFPNRAMFGVGAFMIILGSYGICVSSYNDYYSVRISDFVLILRFADSFRELGIFIAIAVISARAGSRQRIRRQQVVQD